VRFHSIDSGVRLGFTKLASASRFYAGMNGSAVIGGNIDAVGFDLMDEI
jgi:hypothetical protein